MNLLVLVSCIQVPAAGAQGGYEPDGPARGTPEGPVARTPGKAPSALHRGRPLHRRRPAGGKGSLITAHSVTL